MEVVCVPRKGTSEAGTEVQITEGELARYGGGVWRALGDLTIAP